MGLQKSVCVVLYTLVYCTHSSCQLCQCQTSFVHSLKNHEVRINFIAHLKHIQNSNINRRLSMASSIKISELTSLNTIRLHEMLPKMVSPTDSWATTKMIGSDFHASRGSRYHFSWSSAKLISSNAIETRSPNSQIPNTVTIASNIWTNNAISAESTPASSCWKNRKLKA